MLFAAKTKHPEKSQIPKTVRQQFGFRFPSPFRFFDLPADRSELPTTGFGIRSVSVANRKVHRESPFWS
jgi:hypothetical protein